jgi:ubiquinone/menaquinone biosynthesis C-methylase UbiE
MGLFSRVNSHVNSGTSSGGYYHSMNQALFRINEEYTMLHYPLHGSDNDSFMKAQANLTDYCMSLVPDVKGKVLLEVGCGNGIQAFYIMEHYSPGMIKAIDLNSGNIEIARKEAASRGCKTIDFHVDDAHDLSSVEDNSVDVIINVESAFHYPDKPAFFRQAYRVLRPGGTIVIADILTKKGRSHPWKGRWKRKMSYYHWPMERYNRELPMAEIQILKVSDITPGVIRGFRNYRRWITEMERRRFLEDSLMKIYYTIHARLNIYLLRRTRQYCVFLGRKG